MSIEEMIKEIHISHPELAWLMRSIDDDERERIPGAFMAHLFDPKRRDAIGNLLVSYVSYASTPDAALWSAKMKADGFQ